MSQATYQANRLQDVKERRLIRVFISSTFRDMIEDRNELMSQCWPQLRALCRKRQVELSEIDLRWGISEEQSQRKETLRLCLDEIQKCRPFFLGLLGERYGWVPDSDAITPDLVQEQSWLSKLSNTSITELEILHGVLNDPKMTDRSYFYFRDPAYARTRGGDFLPESVEMGKKQSDLKERIRKTCAAKDIPLYEGYKDPQELAKLVLEQFTQVIEELFPENEIPDPLDKEAAEQEAFAASRRLTYIGRESYYNALDKHVIGDGKPLIITGASGGGKSALLANWVQHWRKEHPDDFVFQHYIGSTVDSSNAWKLLRRLLSEIKKQTGDESEIPQDNDEMRRDLPLWLFKARLWAEKNGKRFIILLDALNQIEDIDNAHLLAWLPDEPFQGSLRLIVSSLEGACLDSLKPRNWNYLQVEPLQPEEKAKLIRQYLKRFGKELDVANTQIIVSAPQSENPLYLKILLDELRVTGTFEGLNEHINEYLKAEDISQLLWEVFLRWQTDYERDRPDLVRDALSFIYASRRGLSESELLELLRPEDQSKLPAAIWSPLRAALDESLVERNGILNFAFDYLKQAVQSMFLPDLKTLNDIRLHLAGYFEALEPSPRSCDELPWLLFTTESYQRLQSCLLDIDRFLLIFGRDKDELRHYWVKMGAQNTMSTEYPLSFTAWEAATTPPDFRVSYAANELANFLREMSLHVAAELLYRRALEIDEAIYGPEHPDVAIALNNLAQLLKTTNRPTDAEPLMRRALEIDEASYGSEHPSVARDLNNLATLLHATNRSTEAEPLLRQALEIDEAIYGPEHPDVARDLSNLAVLLLCAINRPTDAEPLMRRALAIDEAIFGPEHPDVARDLNNLAAFLYATNRLEEAEPLIYRALEINEASYGPEHPKVAINLNNLALLMHATNHLEEAEPLVYRALEINEASYGPEHPEVAINLNNLALLMHDTNRLEEAEPLYRRALEIDEASYGPEHPSVAIDLNNLAKLLHDTNRLDEAEPLMHRALEISEANYGPEHPDVANSLNNLAGLLRDTNRLEKAELLYRRALAIDEASYGPEHPDVARDLNNLAVLLHFTNRLDEAELLYCRALRIYEDSCRLEHPNVPICLSNLASLLQDSNRTEAAESLMHRYVEILIQLTRTMGQQHPDLIKSVNNYGSLLMQMGLTKEQAVEKIKEIAPELFEKGQDDV